MNPEEILASLTHATDETEFFTPMPTGYCPGKTKYVVVFGTVMSGLGKGIFSSSLAKVLQDKGFGVAPIKLLSTVAQTAKEDGKTQDKQDVAQDGAGQGSSHQFQHVRVDGRVEQPFTDGNNGDYELRGVSERYPMSSGAGRSQWRSAGPHPTAERPPAWPRSDRAGSRRRPRPGRWRPPPQMRSQARAQTTAAEDGGAIECLNAAVLELRNCILWGDSAADAGDEINIAGGSVTSYYCNIQGSGGSGNWQAGFGEDGDGNIDTDPLFVDATAYNVHLKSTKGHWTPGGFVEDSVTSPCIDTGDPTMPVGDEQGPNGNLINMGRYGGTSQASLSPFRGTLMLIR